MRQVIDLSAAICLEGCTKTDDSRIACLELDSANAKGATLFRFKQRNILALEGHKCSLIRIRTFLYTPI